MTPYLLREVPIYGGLFGTYTTCYVRGDEEKVQQSGEVHSVAP